MVGQDLLRRLDRVAARVHDAEAQLLAVEAHQLQLLDRIVQRLMEEGYLNVSQAPQVPQGYQSMFGPGGQAHSAAQQVQFNLTEKGIDFLGYKTLKNLLQEGDISVWEREKLPLLKNRRAEVYAKHELISR